MSIKHESYKLLHRICRVVEINGKSYEFKVAANRIKEDDLTPYDVIGTVRDLENPDILHKITTRFSEYRKDDDRNIYKVRYVIDFLDEMYRDLLEIALEHEKDSLIDSIFKLLT